MPLTDSRQLRNVRFQLPEPLVKKVKKCHSDD